MAAPDAPRALACRNARRSRRGPCSTGPQRGAGDSRSARSAASRLTAYRRSVGSVVVVELVVVVKLVVVEPSEELVDEEEVVGTVALVLVVGATTVVVVAGIVVVHCPPQSSGSGRPTARRRMRRASLAVMRQSASTSQTLFGHELSPTATRRVKRASEAVGVVPALTGMPQAPTAARSGRRPIVAGPAVKRAAAAATEATQTSSREAAAAREYDALREGRRRLCRPRIGADVPHALSGFQILTGAAFYVCRGQRKGVARPHRGCAGRRVRAGCLPRAGCVPGTGGVVGAVVRRKARSRRMPRFPAPALRKVDFPRGRR